MKPTHTSIAVALAFVVVIAFFIFPGLSPFKSVALDESAVEITMNSDTTMYENVTELKVTDTTVGTGPAAASGDVVTVDYVGSLTNGTVFDASANHGSQGFTFNLGAGQVIQGWDQGIVGMKEGGKRTLVIPASLAYGNQSVANVIPANSTLVFEVQLLKVEKKAQ